MSFPKVRRFFILHTYGEGDQTIISPAGRELGLDGFVDRDEIAFPSRSSITRSDLCERCRVVTEDEFDLINLYVISDGGDSELRIIPV